MMDRYDCHRCPAVYDKKKVDELGEEGGVLSILGFISCSLLLGIPFWAISEVGNAILSAFIL